MPIFEYKCGDCGALTEFLEAVKSKKKVRLSTDDRGLPIVDTKKFFGSMS